MAAPTNAWVQYGVRVPGASFESTERTKAFGVGMNNDGRRILDMAEVYMNERTGLKVVREVNKREETHDKVCVDVLDSDTLGRQLGCERIRPSAEEGFAA